MNIRDWVDRLQDEFWGWGSINAYPRNAVPYCDVLDSAQGMTTPSNMHLLNLAVQEMSDTECYLEVGTWRGTTLIGALLGNDKRGYAVDNDVMNEHDGDERSSYDVWVENTQRFAVDRRASYIEGSTPEVWERLQLPAPVGVYFFDGDKATEMAAHDGLAGVIPFLADEALIIIDDANEITIRLAASKLEREHSHQLLKIIDYPTPGNCWPCFWNGVMVLAFYRRG